jgi:hypothetical protein
MHVWRRPQTDWREDMLHENEEKLPC